MRLITGEELRAIRQYSTLTINEIKDIVGVKTRSTVINWERNIGRPNINQFLRLLKASCISDKQYFQLMAQHKAHELICVQDLVKLETR